MELISRDEAIKTVHKYFIKLFDKIPTETDEDGDTVFSDMKTVNSLLSINKWLTKEIKAIPTVEERKEGRWVRITQDVGLRPHQYMCTECGRIIEYGSSESPRLLEMRYPYCHCGARMKGEE